MIAGANKNMTAIKLGYVITVNVINEIAAMKIINLDTFAVFCFLKLCAIIICSTPSTIHV